MTISKLILRSLIFYRRTHLGVLLGAVIGTAILTGALVVGDSVRFSLKKMALARLGHTEFALAAGDRFFRAGLAADLATTPGVKVAPVLKLNGIVTVAGTDVRANRIQVLGVDDRFWRLGSVRNPLADSVADKAVINAALASRLALEPGDEVLLRVEKINIMPGEVPFSARELKANAFRLTVTMVAADDQFGRFGLETGQVAPLTVFLPLAELASKMDLEDKANVLLVPGSNGHNVSLEQVNAALANHWRLADGELVIRELAGPGVVEMISSRVFLDQPVVTAARQANPAARGILTYFVNSIKCNDASTPYSFVSAAGAPLVPPDLADDDIIINDWLARDLDAEVGDTIHLTYFVPGAGGQLREDSASFRVHSIAPILNQAETGSLTPMLPGLSEVDNCRDWDPGIPIDLARIRAQDERYWDDYRDTPKALITLNAGQRLWANRFGSLTAIRFPGTLADHAHLEADILAQLAPASLGLVFWPIRQQALQASSEAVDFGQLFLGLSFFIILAALLLTGLLFVLSLDQRSEEIATLLALGYRAGTVKWILLAEGAVLAVVGAILGLVCAIGYNQLVLYGLGTLWRGAVGTSALVHHLKPATLVTGLACGIITALLAMWLATRKLIKKTVIELTTGTASLEQRATRKQSRLNLWITCTCLVLVLVILITINPGKDKNAAGAFWAAGALMLMGSLSLCHWSLLRLREKTGQAKLSLTNIGRRASTRKKGRSLATIALLASGIFIVIGVGANRHDALKDAHQRAAGTGGFLFYGETTLPVLPDLNTGKSQRQFGLTDANVSARFVQLRVRAGDDASCLNLNRIQTPRILGVDPAELASRGAFAFAKIAAGLNSDDPWLNLNQDLGANVIPAIADQTVIVWGLGKAVGDTLHYIDEHGRKLGLKLVGGLVNSIFQGNVIISEKNFMVHFPSISGSRVLLVDAAPEDGPAIRQALTRSMQDYGLELIPAAERLAAFNTVANTYLSIFLALGGLGLLLGTVGLGVIVFRNVMERRGELALLRAVGFNHGLIQRLLQAENILLLAGGVLCGTVSAIVAVLPAILSPGAEIPYIFLVLTLSIISASGALWTLLATRLATRGDLLMALRNE